MRQNRFMRRAQLLVGVLICALFASLLLALPPAVAAEEPNYRLLNQEVTLKVDSHLRQQLRIVTTFETEPNVLTSYGFITDPFIESGGVRAVNHVRIHSDGQAPIEAHYVPYQNEQITGTSPASANTYTHLKIAAKNSDKLASFREVFVFVKAASGKVVVDIELELNPKATVYDDYVEMFSNTSDNTWINYPSAMAGQMRIELPVPADVADARDQVLLYAWDQPASLLPPATIVSHYFAGSGPLSLGMKFAFPRSWVVSAEELSDVGGYISKKQGPLGQGQGRYFNPSRDEDKFIGFYQSEDPDADDLPWYWVAAPIVIMLACQMIIGSIAINQVREEKARRALARQRMLGLDME